MAYNKDIVVFKVSNYVFGVQKTNVVISFQDSGQNVKNVILGFIVKKGFRTFWKVVELSGRL